MRLLGLFLFVICIATPIRGEDKKLHLITESVCKIPRAVTYKLPATVMLTPSLPLIDKLMANLVMDDKKINSSITSKAFTLSGYAGLKILTKNADIPVKKLSEKIKRHKFLKLCEFYTRPHFTEILSTQTLPYDLKCILREYDRYIREEDIKELPFLYNILSFSLDSAKTRR